MRRARTAAGGFTLVELVVALVLGAAVAGMSYDVLLEHSRLSRWQLERAQLDQNIRSAAAVLPAELRDLDPQDPAGGDIVTLSDTAVTYRAMRGLHVLCRPPVVDRGSASVIVVTSPVSDARDPVPGQDSALVLVAGSGTGDDRWIHAAIATVGSGACADGTPGMALRVSAAGGGDSLAGVVSGAPLRITQPVSMRGYRDSSGDWWVGVSEYQGTGRWSAIQPLVGPIAPRGLRFRSYDAAGGETSDAARVARLAITIVGRSSVPVRTPDGDPDFLTDSLTVQVALRGSTAR
jgi:prepilin-type N-terminal cleavage/methylation domain-containing protein